MHKVIMFSKPNGALNVEFELTIDLVSSNEPIPKSSRPL
jgi:hypothetical protein